MPVIAHEMVQTGCGLQSGASLVVWAFESARITLGESGSGDTPAQHVRRTDFHGVRKSGGRPGHGHQRRAVRCAFGEELEGTGAFGLERRWT